MAVVLKEQLELRPSVALQKKVGLKSLEQVIRWGDRVNQELRRWRKLEDKKCWRARARCIRKKSRGGSSDASPPRNRSIAPMGGVRARVTWPCYVIANGNHGSHYPSRPNCPAWAPLSGRNPSR